ncbi:ABC transporter permease [Ornithobacterium rhinotracheale]|uniref:ABC transporter permease n=1 Tax=Ornithobacterium rhinotracheale TaxID=28251 RepID=UPI0040357E54
MNRFINRIHLDAGNFYYAMMREFKNIFSDVAVLFSFILVSTVVSFLYAYVYSDEVLTELPVAYVDLDNTAYSRQFIRMMDETEQVSMNHHYAQFPEAVKAFEEEKVRGIIVVPENFSKNLQKSQQPTVSAYTDGAYILYYKQVLTAAKYAVAYMGAGVEIKKIEAKGNLPKVAQIERAPLTGSAVNLYNSNAGYGTFLIPVVLVIIFQTTMLQAIGILGGTMRENHKMVKLYPNANHTFGMLPIVMGKATTYLIISLCILVYMVGFVMPYFHIPMRGNLLEVVVYMIPFLLSVVYLGLFLLNFFRKREDAILAIMFTSIPALLVTGFSWPTDAIPWYIEGLSNLVPTTLGAKGFVAITQMGADINLMQKEFVYLWLLCIFYLILAALTFKRIYLIEQESLKKREKA